jgi:O-antigen ligase
MESRSSSALGACDLLLLGAVTGLPWFWGGVGLDAYRAAAAVVALAAGLALARGGASGLGLGRGTLWLLPAFLLGAFAVLQSAPLPRSWVRAVSPEAASVQSSAFGGEGQGAAAWLRGLESEARALVPEASPPATPGDAILALGPQAPAPPRRFTLSLQPDATFERACWYFALLLAFLLVLRRTASERRARAYRAALFAMFGALAVVSTLNRLTAPRLLLWLRDAPPDAKPFGPYVNPSHFGGVMELAVPWLLGCGLLAFARRHETGRRFDARFLMLGGAAMCAAAALFAASKMAAITIGVASTVLIAIAIASHRGRGRTALLAGTVVAALALGALAVSGPLRGRIVDFEAVHQGEVSRNVRGLVWSAGLRMARDYPVSGSGFGAFGEIFPAYLPRGESGRWQQAHNDYLEVYLGGGVVAAGLVLWLAVAFGARLARALRAHAAQGRLLPALGLALGLLALAVHETVDFNLQIPANALLFVVIAAMGVAPLSRSERAG